jgi:hypothetical protein
MDAEGGMMMANDRGDERLVLRLPSELYRALEALAKREQRSLNGQIVAMLTASVGEQIPGLPDQDAGNWEELA